MHMLVGYMLFKLTKACTEFCKQGWNIYIFPFSLQINSELIKGEYAPSLCRDLFKLNPFENFIAIYLWIKKTKIVLKKFFFNHTNCLYIFWTYLEISVPFMYTFSTFSHILGTVQNIPKPKIVSKQGGLMIR